MRSPIDETTCDQKPMIIDPHTLVGLACGLRRLVVRQAAPEGTRTGLDWSSLDLIRFDWTELDWTGINLDWTIRFDST